MLKAKVFLETKEFVRIGKKVTEVLTKRTKSIAYAGCHGLETTHSEAILLLSEDLSMFGTMINKTAFAYKTIRIHIYGDNYLNRNI